MSPILKRPLLSVIALILSQPSSFAAGSSKFCEQDMKGNIHPQQLLHSSENSPATILRTIDTLLDNIEDCSYDSEIGTRISTTTDLMHEHFENLTSQPHFNETLLYLCGKLSPLASSELEDSLRKKVISFFLEKVFSDVHFISLNNKICMWGNCVNMCRDATQHSQLVHFGHDFLSQLQSISQLAGSYFEKNNKHRIFNIMKEIEEKLQSCERSQKEPLRKISKIPPKLECLGSK